MDPFVAQGVQKMAPGSFGGHSSIITPLHLPPQTVRKGRVSTPTPVGEVYTLAVVLMAPTASVTVTSDIGGPAFSLLKSLILSDGCQFKIYQRDEGTTRPPTDFDTGAISGYEVNYTSEPPVDSVTVPAPDSSFVDVIFNFGIESDFQVSVIQVIGTPVVDADYSGSIAGGGSPLPVTTGTGDLPVIVFAAATEGGPSFIFPSTVPNLRITESSTPHTSSTRRMLGGDSYGLVDGNFYTYQASYCVMYLGTPPGVTDPTGSLSIMQPGGTDVAWTVIRLT